MRFRFTDEQLELRDAVRDLLANECPASVVRAAWEGDMSGPDKVWAGLCDMGVVGLMATEAHGGLGLSDLDLTLILTEVGRAAAPGPLVETAVVAVPLLEKIGGSVAETWVPRVAQGESRVAVGLPGESLVLDASGADLLLLWHGDALHAVDPAEVSITVETSVDRSRRGGRVAWEPGPQPLAVGEEGRRLLDAALERAALGTAAMLLGLGRHLLDVTVTYATDRHQFGVPIGSQQAIKHKLADVAVALAFAEPLVHRAAYSLARGPALVDESARETTAVHVSMAKAAAGDAAELAARHALQCHGAIGYSFEHDLHLWMKRVWALAAAYGDARMHRERIARAIL
ncbi:MAG: acyl-CoA/acyl-ACP dehydrogenase [Acidimicrobiia bacterium]|nr:acyl-CoA/acyl-ACP dehydrogenase [Acidimicrobiia bacterium]